MSKVPSQPTRRQFLVVSASATPVMFLLPVSATAGLSVTVRVLSLTPFADVGIDVPVAALLRGAGRFIPVVGTGLALYGVYQIGKRIWDAVTQDDEPLERRHHDSRQTASPQERPYEVREQSAHTLVLPEPIEIVIRVDEVTSGEVLRIRFAATDLIDIDDRIALGGDRSLHLEEDGKMRFVGCSFSGYALMDRHGRLSVWNTLDEMVLVLTRHERDLWVLRSDTSESLVALRALVGDDHAS